MRKRLCTSLHLFQTFGTVSYFYARFSYTLAVTITELHEDPTKLNFLLAAFVITSRELCLSTVISSAILCNFATISFWCRVAVEKQKHGRKPPVYTRTIPGDT